MQLPDFSEFSVNEAETMLDRSARHTWFFMMTNAFQMIVNRHFADRQTK
jgi:hypothetical protein